MNIYRGLSETILELAIKKHNLNEWYNSLADSQIEGILLSLDEKINIIIGSYRDELDKFAATAVIMGESQKQNDEEQFINKCKNVSEKSEEPIVGVKIVNNTDLSDKEVRKMGTELVDRFATLLGM